MSLARVHALVHRETSRLRERLGTIFALESLRGFVGDERAHVVDERVAQTQDVDHRRPSPQKSIGL